MNKLAHQKAFTLLELLSVIGIVTLLAALLFPALGKMRGYADNIKCVSNLRQLGVGINLYATDNDDRLPGPIGSGLGRVLANTQSSQLIYQLQPYLDLPSPTSTPVYAEILHCPALRRDFLGSQANWYDVTAYAGYSNNDLPNDKKYLKDRTVIDGNGRSWPVGPWGRSNSSPATPGWRRAWLADSIDETKTTPTGQRPTLSMIPAIREIDASLKSWPWPVPTKPVHGNHYNVLFFDWHVEGASLTEFK